MVRGCGGIRDDGCLDRGGREVAGDVIAEVGSVRAVRLEAARGDRDEPGVLAGEGGDEHVVVGLSPAERLPGSGGGEDQECLRRMRRSDVVWGAGTGW